VAQVVKSEPLAVLDLNAGSLGCWSQIVSNKAGSVKRLLPLVLVDGKTKSDGPGTVPAYAIHEDAVSSKLWSRQFICFIERRQPSLNVERFNVVRNIRLRSQDARIANFGFRSET
jgi:hypothetical protein